MTEYTFSLSNGNVLGNVLALENNGPGSMSVPRQILDIDFSGSTPAIVLADDLHARFVAGFQFSVIDSPYAGTYQVASGGSVFSGNVTLVPLDAATPLAAPTYAIAAVTTGANGTFTVVGLDNGALVFYPTSTITVAGNAFPAANGTYVVNSCDVSMPGNITANVTGLAGSCSWSIAGDQTGFYRPGFTFNVQGNPGAGQYTVVSSSYAGGATTIAVIESIPSGTPALGQTVLKPGVAVIHVSGSISNSATASGTISGQPPIQLVQVLPPTVTPSVPGVAFVTWYVGGDYTQEIQPGAQVTIKGNNVFSHERLPVTAVAYNPTGSGFTAITTRASVQTTPAVTQTGVIVFPPPATPFGAVQYVTTPALSPLKLVGRGSAAYNSTTSWGQALQDNQIHVLENFANTTAPISPLVGQFWYDTTVSAPQLRFRRDSSNWESVLVSGIGSTNDFNLNNHKLTNVAMPTSALDVANKSYVDQLANGIIWLQPVLDPSLFDDTLSAPPLIDFTVIQHKTYIVKAPGTGAWAGLDGRAVAYGVTYVDPATQVATYGWIDILGRAVQTGDRFGVFFEPDPEDTLASLPTGGLAPGGIPQTGKIATITSVSPLAYSFFTPQEPHAVYVTGSNPISSGLTNTQRDRSPHYGHAYTFRGTWGVPATGPGPAVYGKDFTWIEFSGPAVLTAGAGLRYTGNILNVGQGTGISVAADAVSIDTTYLDSRYVNVTGDTMTGMLNISMASGSTQANFGIATDGDRGMQFVATGAGASGTAMMTTNGANYQMLLGINGNEKMRIDTNGNVGINIGAMTYKLEVGASGVLALNDSTNANKGTFQMTAGGLELYTGPNKYIAFGTNSSERVRIDASGNIGINVTPSAWHNAARPVQFGTAGAVWGYSSTQLNTNQGVYYDGSYRYLNTGVAAMSTSMNSGALYVQQFPAGTAGAVATPTTPFMIDASGRVGINTASPDSPLTVAGMIHTTTGGVKYPDGSVQITAATGATAGGSTGQIQYNNSGSFAGASAVSTSGTNLAIGASSMRSIAGFTPTVQLEESSGSANVTTISSMSIVRDSNDTLPYGPQLIFGRSNGTSTGSNVAVNRYDTLGNVLFAGSDGSSMTGIGAMISGKAYANAASWAPAGIGGYLTFSAMPTSATSSAGITGLSETVRMWPGRTDFKCASGSQYYILNSASATSSVNAPDGMRIVFDTSGIQKISLTPQPTALLYAANINGYGQLLLNDNYQTAARSVGGSVRQLTIDPGSYSQVSGSIAAVQSSADTVGATIVLAKSRGSSSTDYTTVQSGDTLGSIVFAGTNGTNANSLGASIVSKAAQTFTTGASGAYLSFNTTPIGSTTNVEAMRITSQGVIQDAAGNELGYKDLPVNAQTAAYVATLADRGKMISITTGGVTVPSGVFSPGQTFLVYNNSGSSQTIAQGAGVTMYLTGTGTTGNRTLAQHGMASILCVDVNTFVINGGGVS